MTRTFDGTLDSWTYDALCDTEYVAEEVIRRYAEFAPRAPRPKNRNINDMTSTGNDQMAETHHSKSTHHRFRSRRLYGGGLYRTRLTGATLITGMEVGGQLSITTDAENYPGFADADSRPWLMEQMHAQAEHVGTRMINDLIIDVNFWHATAVCLQGDSGETYSAILSSFRPERRRVGWDWKRNRSFRALAVPACATCDGLFSIAKNKSRWSAAVIPQLRRRCT